MNQTKAEVGEYVVVPFGKKDSIGVVDQFENENSNKNSKLKNQKIFKYFQTK